MQTGLAQRSTERELIDAPICPADELAESFRDIALINRWFGGTSVARFGLRHARPNSVLDVACGTGDIAISLRRKYRHTEQRDVRFTCLDRNPELVSIGRAAAGGDPGITFLLGDASELPFETNAFDATMCNLSLHHFDPPLATTVLRELRRVAAVMPLVTDLRRGALSFAAAYAFSRVFTRNRLTRNDAPLSARRAYTPQEAIELARAAGWKSPRVERYRFIRMVLYDAATL